MTITDLTLGEEFIRISNARVKLGEADGNLVVLLDFAFDDQLTFAVETQAVVNWPKPGMASLPISLTFNLNKFSGTVLCLIDCRLLSNLRAPKAIPAIVDRPLVILYLFM